MYIETQTKKLVHIFQLKFFITIYQCMALIFIFLIYIFSVITILDNFHLQDEVWTKWKMIMFSVVWWKNIRKNYDNIKIPFYNFRFRCLICFEISSMFCFKTHARIHHFRVFHHMITLAIEEPQSWWCLAVELSPWNFTLHKIQGVRCCHLSNAWDGTRLSLELYLKTRLKGWDVATIIFSSSALQRNHNKAWNAHITCISSQFCASQPTC